MAEEPVSEEPELEAEVEEPVVEEPELEAEVEEPVVEEPVAEEPVSEEPVEEALVEEPVIEEPVVEALVEEPSASEDLPDFGEEQEISLEILFPDSDTNILEVFAEDAPPASPISFAVTEFSPDTAGNNTPGTEQFEEDFPDVAQNGYDADVISPNTIAIANPTRFADTIDLSGVDFYTYRITDVTGTLPAIEDVTIDPASNLEIDPEAISFTEDTIEVDLAGTVAPRQTAVLLNVDFANDGGFIPTDGSEDFAPESNEQFISELGF